MYTEYRILRNILYTYVYSDLDIKFIFPYER